MPILQRQLSGIQIFILSLNSSRKLEVFWNFLGHFSKVKVQQEKDFLSYTAIFERKNIIPLFWCYDYFDLKNSVNLCKLYWWIVRELPLLGRSSNIEWTVFFTVSHLKSATQKIQTEKFSVNECSVLLWQLMTKRLIPYNF